MVKRYAGYLIDLDGTMYRGDEEIDGASEFIRKLVESDLPYLFITNNASLSQQTIADKLISMGISATAKHIYTSAIATAKYISMEAPGAKCFIIGEDALIDACICEGLKVVRENADYVIMGLDREITYEKLTIACLEVRNGAKFISTNPDKVIPKEHSLFPGNGALTAVVASSTGVAPLYVGKPEAIIMKQAIELLGVTSEEVLMIGDNYETDILAGINAEIDTLMVCTGVTSVEEVARVAIKPTYIADDLLVWIDK